MHLQPNIFITTIKVRRASKLFTLKWTNTKMTPLSCNCLGRHHYSMFSFSTPPAIQNILDFKLKSSILMWKILQQPNQIKPHHTHSSQWPCMPLPLPLILIPLSLNLLNIWFNRSWQRRETKIPSQSRIHLIKYHLTWVFIQFQAF